MYNCNHLVQKWKKLVSIDVARVNPSTVSSVETKINQVKIECFKKPGEKSGKVKKMWKNGEKLV